MQKGTMYRTGLQLYNLGVRLRWVWLVQMGIRIKNKAMGEFV